MDGFGWTPPDVIETVGEEVFPAPTGSRPLGCPPCNGVGQQASESGVPWGKIVVGGLVLGVLGAAWYFGTKKSKPNKSEGNPRPSRGAGARFLGESRRNRRRRRDEDRPRRRRAA
jgi:hypothetical protein